MTFLTETHAHWPKANRLRILQAVTLIGLTLLAAITGPFGTFESGGFAARLVYWSVAIAVSLMIALGIKYALRDLYRTPRFWLAELSICIGTTIAFTPILYIWTLFWFPTAAVILPNPVWMGLNVLAICAIVSGLRYGLPVLGVFPDRGADGAAGLPRLVDRLEPQLRAPVLRLEAEGHYVLVVTEAGESRLRLRLTDAIREMEPVPGHGTHRSHWVACAAIERSGSAAGKPVLHLSNGEVVPVSRKFRPELQDAGLI